MTFENTLYVVNTKMEKRAFDEETCKISLFEREKLEEPVTLLDIDVDSKGMVVLKVAIGKITNNAFIDQIIKQIDKLIEEEEKKEKEETVKINSKKKNKKKSKDRKNGEKSPCDEENKIGRSAEGVELLVDE